MTTRFSMKHFEALGDVHSYAPRLVQEGLPYQTLALTLGDPSCWARYLGARAPHHAEIDPPGRGETIRANVPVWRGRWLGVASYIVRTNPSRWAGAYSREVADETGAVFDWRRVPRQTFGFWFVESPQCGLRDFLRHVRAVRPHARRTGIDKRHFVVPWAATMKWGWLTDGRLQLPPSPRDVRIEWAGNVMDNAPVDYTDCVIVLDPA